MRLDYRDRSQDRIGWARDLGVSSGALDLYLRSEVVDLHVDTFIWHRLLGYDLCRRHRANWLRGWFFSQVDLPRIREAQVAGAMWAITTNPMRSAAGRLAAFRSNLANIRSQLARAPDDVSVIRSWPEYAQARAAGKHAAMIAVQGGNALDAGPQAWSALDGGWVSRITVVHMTRSHLGTSSAVPSQSRLGLTGLGRDFVRELNRRRILVDVAHMSKQAFRDTVEVHDRSLPLIATHTGVDGVYPCWRNLDDGQLRRVADSGGVVGIVFHAAYLNGSQFGRARASHVAAHIAHVVRVVGEDFAALGSDFDGLIIPPRDLRSCLHLPILAQAMLDEGLTERAVHKILGANFLRVLKSIRGQ